MAENSQHKTLGVISLGLAIGLTAAIATFILGVMAHFFGWGVPLAMVLGSVFLGFGPTFIGSIAGAVWAFVDGFIIGIMIAWFYNRFLLHRRRHL